MGKVGFNKNAAIEKELIEYLKKNGIALSDATVKLTAEFVAQKLEGRVTVN